MSVSFIAEISSNHNQQLERCLALVDKAAEIGCDAVKFQLFRIHQLFAPEILNRSEVHRRRREWELPIEFIPEIAGRCRRAGLRFGCTPFYLEAVDILLPYVDFFKIASYELLWRDLLTACGGSGKPVMLSTGMASPREIREAVNTLHQAGCEELTLFHCLSSYPVLPEQCNLAALKTLRDSYQCPVGWSDHSVCPAVIYRVVHHWEAASVEFHLDLEGEGREFSGRHCWLPNQIADVIQTIKKGFLADGEINRKPGSCERDERMWRADPSDGLRPLRPLRDGFIGDPTSG